MNIENPICSLCKSPVIVERDRYDVFEKMHWLCFHIVFEHFADPDEPCDDPSCPWVRILAYEDKLRELGLDPVEVNLEWSPPGADD